MSYFYYQVLKRIKNKISTLALFAEQLFLNFIFYALLTIFIEYFKNPPKNQDAFNSILIVVIVFTLIARALSLSIRNKIFQISPLIKTTFPQKEREKLIWEIERSLKNSSEFSKWSCGILATLLALLVSIVSNIYFSTLDKIGTKEEIIDIISSNSQFFSNLFPIIIEMSTALILIVLAYYLALQLPTYNRRLVLRVLRNCSYEVNSNFTNQSKFEKFLSYIQELFFWDTIKHIFNDYTNR
ncbi:hypothetical protein [Streptococcus agalactiae]|uniref:hypothetical protein n=1 Tax=Streptococcus agalactiae TaxID=1311 RepID=UPI0013033264|nr:hypothetical protein [Streptococcus agalactiae]KAF0052056.1 hypothetical protein GL192_00820 [Streptococcus agalactiae]